MDRVDDEMSEVVRSQGTGLEEGTGNVRVPISLLLGRCGWEWASWVCEPCLGHLRVPFFQLP